MLRRSADFILANRTQAMGLAFLTAYIPVVGIASILIAGLVTLRKGAKEGALVLFAATMPYLLTYLTLRHAQGADGLITLLILSLIASNIIVWLLAVILQRYNNWVFVLDVSLILGLVLIALIHLAYPNIQQWWGAQLTGFMTKTNAMMGEMNALSAVNMSIGMDPATLTALSVKINTVKNYITGLLVALFLVNSVMLLMIARIWEIQAFNPGRGRQELYALRMSQVCGVILVLAAVLAYFGNGLAMDMMPVIIGVFALPGLSLLHFILATVKNGWVTLAIIYVGILIFGQITIMFLALLGWLDVWLNLRQRWLARR